MAGVDPGQPRHTADIGALKALANPLRQRILRHLSLHGPATSTGLAQTLGGTTGGTSYNLRVLAAHGFVEEVPEKARGRERWWRATQRDTRIPVRSEQDPQMRTTVEQLRELWLAEDAETLARFQDRRDELGEWADAMPFSRGTIQVTPDELGAFFEDYLALLARYRKPAEQVPPGARTVLTHFLAFPAVEPRGDAS